MQRWPRLRLRFHGQCYAQIVPRIRVVWSQADRFPEFADGGINLPFSEQRDTQIIVWIRIARLQPDGFFALGNCSRKLPFLGQRHA